MSETREPFYKPRSNGTAMRRARHAKGLEEEIALLRVKLKEFIAQDKPDEGLILSTVNTLGRALMAQARIRGIDPGAARTGVAAVIRRLGSILEDE